MENILIDISYENPAGQDLKYDDAFVQIELEVDKSYSVSAEEDTDWQNVKNNCNDFLKMKSKDLKIAVWWLFANWHLDKWTGLSQSLVVFNQFLEKYNESLFPKPVKARQNTLVWLESILTREIVEKKLFQDELTNSAELSELFQSTQNTFKELMQSDDNYFSKIIRHLKSLEVQTVKSIPEQLTHKEKKADLDQKEMLKQEPQKEEKPILTIKNKDEASKVFQNFKKSASMLSEYYRKENPFDLKAIKISRLLSWINVEDIPVHKEGLTQINPPSETTLLKIRESFESGEKEEVFKLLQTTLERSPYWLDGHYESYKILEEAGKHYEAQEILNNLIAFIRSHKGLEDLKFKNDTPFISHELEHFLHTKITDNEEQTKKDAAADVMEDIFAKIKKITQNHQTKEAMQLLQNEYNAALNYEDKFKLRLELVKLNIINKKNKMTSALLSGLEQDVQKYHLDEWHPDLALEVYTLFLKHFDGQQNEEKINNVYERLCKIDVSQAFNLK